MIETAYDRGIFLPQAELWLDPRDRKEFAFVSHAHSDHTGRHRRILCTPPTARLMQVRMGSPAGTFATLPFHAPQELAGGTVTLLPAGHVLGSAQLHYASSAGTLLYTGDFKLRRGQSSESAAAMPADTLIMETTYGLSRYHFPPVEETIAAIRKFCLEALEDQHTPVLLGYALGKAQEILSVLRDAGAPITLHPAIAQVAAVYEEFGVTFPPYDILGNEPPKGVLICPPGFKASRALAKLRRRRVAMLSGWAMDAGAARRMQVDAAFPLSDHADYADLLRHVDAVRPRRVLTLHGFAQEFARDLRARGLEAWALTGANQLEFSLAVPAPGTRRPAAPARLANEGFPAFCLVAESIRTATGRREKIRILAAYFRSLPEDDLPLAVVWLGGRPFPQCDDRPVQAGSAIIRRALRQAAGISEPELRAIGRRHSDSGLTAFEVLQSAAGGESVPLQGIRDVLDRLRSARGPVLKTEILAATLLRLPALAGSYLVRILTGDLRIGLKDGLVEDAIAAAFEADPGAVREAHMLLGDAGRTALLAKCGRLEDAELTLFQPIKCMLASPEADAPAIWARLGSAGSVWVEDKLDGIRAQIHCSGERAEIYSRDLKRITDSFPEIARAALSFGRPFVCDGEILAWNGVRARSFSDLQKRLGRTEGDLFLGGQIPVTCVVFDLLALDGRSLLPTPLSGRREILETLRLPAAFQTAVVRQARSAAEIDRVFTEARNRGNEGLMIKDPSSAYAPGRRGQAWIKYKKAFATLDVVVTAVTYGHGRRRGVLSDYTFAVRDDAGGTLLTIGKAYSGLTDQEIEDLTDEFLALATARKGNTITVEPEIVLEIAFDGIQPSARHPSGFALRFPRIVRVRKDKTAAEIDTLSAAAKLAGITGPIR